MSVQSTYEIIEAYLGGTLKGADLEAFEQRLKTDKALNKQLLLFKNIDQALEDKMTLDFQKMVQDEGTLFLKKEERKEVTPIRQINWSARFKMIAAALLVLVVSAVVFWNVQSGSAVSGAELFAQNFETYTLNESIRGEQDEAVTSKFEEAIQAYQAKDFAKASKVLENLITTDPDDIVLNFSLANAYVNQSPPELALAQAQFQKIIDDGASIYVPRAKWYLALILLKQENMEGAETLLKEVAKSSDNYGQQARDLLKQISS